MSSYDLTKLQPGLATGANGTQYIVYGAQLVTQSQIGGLTVSQSFLPVVSGVAYQLSAGSAFGVIYDQPQTSGGVMQYPARLVTL